MSAAHGELPAPLEIGAVSAEQVLAFARASLDMNPVHLSEQAAKAAGFERPVLHGMFITARLETYLEAVAGFRVAELKLRFVAPALVGTALTLSSRLLKAEQDDLHVRLLASAADRRILVVGEARLRRRSDPSQP